MKIQNIWDTKKSFSDIMEGFIKTRQELNDYANEEQAEAIRQDAIAKEAVIAHNIAVDNIQIAERTIEQLSDIIGDCSL